MAHLQKNASRGILLQKQKNFNIYIVKKRKISEIYLLIHNFP